MANFIPPANGASLSSYLVKNRLFVKKGEYRLTKIALAAKLANLSWNGFFVLYIWTSKRVLHTSFAGQNTQHFGVHEWKNLAWLLFLTYICWIFWPAIGCCLIKMLVEICFFPVSHIFAKSLMQKWAYFCPINKCSATQKSSTTSIHNQYIFYVWCNKQWMHCR